jgi:hypothetical protein
MSLDDEGRGGFSGDETAAANCDARGGLGIGGGASIVTV